MVSSKQKFKVRWLVYLAVLVLSIGIVVSGCVTGLNPIGWSGGIVSDGKLFIGSTQGRLVSINLEDEARRWTDALPVAAQPGLFGCSPVMGGGGCGGSVTVAIYGTPVTYEDLVYIAGYNGKIYAYTTDSLASRWVYPREGNTDPFVSSLIAEDGKLYIGGSDGNVYAFDAATGDKLWEYPTGDKIWGSPAIEGDTLYIGSFDKKLYAIDINTHKEKWVTSSDENGITGAIMAKPLIDRNTVYIGSLDRNLYALNKADGSIKWSFSGGSWFWSNPVIYNGRLYAGCLDDYLYVLNADTGVKVAEYDKGPVAAPPILAGNSIIFATREGKIYKINTESGDITQLADIEQAVDGPLTVEGNILFVHTQDMLLHRINIDNGDRLPSIILSYAE